ncbi:MAG: hemolysin [Planctomycetota bacterium]|nr:MAG: hemolysin [Planctomycetota bacterium]
MSTEYKGNSELHAAGFPDDVPPDEIREGRYLIRFARTPEEVQTALRLRYEIFNLELNEGLEASHVTGHDEDPFDAGCHHLLVIHEGDPAHPVVGTYRLQTREMAQRNAGFYSDGEYVLADMGDTILNDAVEIGRACVAKEHRKQRVLFGLWKGLAAYITHTRKRYLFGCCSLTSQDPRDATETSAYLAANDKLRSDFCVRARPDYACVDADPAPVNVAEVKLPTLFGTYLRFGALACSEPALDREFKTIDYLVVMDTDGLPAATRQMFFGS